MTATKLCPICGAMFERPADCPPSHWKRRVCCSKHCANQNNAMKNRIPREDAERFVALISSGMSHKSAAREVGRTANALLNGVRIFGLNAPKGSNQPPALPPEEDIKTRGVFPLPSGSSETWDILGVGINYAEALAMTAHMRLR